ASTVLSSPLSLHDALPIFAHTAFAQRACFVEERDRESIGLLSECVRARERAVTVGIRLDYRERASAVHAARELIVRSQRIEINRSEEHTSELQSRENIVCR